jgi:hypothetical protein
MMHPFVVIAGPTLGGSPDVVLRPDVDPLYCRSFTWCLALLISRQSLMCGGPPTSRVFRVTSIDRLQSCVGPLNAVSHEPLALMGSAVRGLPRQIENPYELVARRLRRAVQEEETARLPGH